MTRRGRPPKIIYEPVENALPIYEKMVVVEIVMGNPWVDGEKKRPGDVISVSEALAKHLQENGFAVAR